MRNFILPLLDIQFALWIIPVIGFAGGFISAMVGVGSGIIITPVLIMSGIPPQVAVPSQLNNALGTGFSGFLAYFRQGDVDLKLSWYLFSGGIIGALIEFYTLRWLGRRSGDVAGLKILTAAVLAFLGVTMLRQCFRAGADSPLKKPLQGAMMRSWMIYFPFHKIFVRSRTEMSILVPLGVGLVTGLMTSTLGGGTSLFIAPILTYLLGRNTPVVTGTAFLAGFGINLVLVLLHALSQAPADFVLVTMLLLGGTAGSVLGTRISYRFPRSYLNAVGACVIIGISARFLIELHRCGWKNTIAPLTSGCPTTDGLKSFFCQQWAAAAWDFGQKYPFEYTVCCIIGVIALVLLIQGFMQRFVNILNWVKER